LLMMEMPSHWIHQLRLAICWKNLYLKGADVPWCPDQHYIWATTAKQQVRVIVRQWSIHEQHNYNHSMHVLMLPGVPITIVPTIVPTPLAFVKPTPRDLWFRHRILIGRWWCACPSCPIFCIRRWKGAGHV
jgi:hypothetical protein